MAMGLKQRYGHGDPSEEQTQQALVPTSSLGHFIEEWLFAAVTAKLAQLYRNSNTSSGSGRGSSCRCCCVQNQKYER
jgi:hypothetical protein